MGHHGGYYATSTPSVLGIVSETSDSGCVEHYDGRLRRMERSVLRLERINLEILAILKKLVSAVKRSGQESNQ